MEGQTKTHEQSGLYFCLVVVHFVVRCIVISGRQSDMTWHWTTLPCPHLNATAIELLIFHSWWR